MIDAHLAFSPDKQSLPAALTTLSTNVLDCGAAKKLFEGFSHRPPSLSVIGLTTAGAPTLQVQLVGADDAALGVNPVVLADSGIKAAAARFHIEIPVIGQSVAKRYYVLKYTLVGAAGTVDVTGIVGMDPQSNLLA